MIVALPTPANFRGGSRCTFGVCRGAVANKFHQAGLALFRYSTCRATSHVNCTYSQQDSWEAEFMSDRCWYRLSIHCLYNTNTSISLLQNYLRRYFTILNTLASDICNVLLMVECEARVSPKGRTGPDRLERAPLMFAITVTNIHSPLLISSTCWLRRLLKSPGGVETNFSRGFVIPCDPHYLRQRERTKSQD